METQATAVDAADLLKMTKSQLWAHYKQIVGPGKVTLDWTHATKPILAQFILDNGSDETKQVEQEEDDKDEKEPIKRIMMKIVPKPTEARANKIRFRITALEKKIEAFKHAIEALKLKL